MTKPPLKIKCPTCNKEILWDATSDFRPFCSKRCQLIDLGDWANENHVIGGSSELEKDFNNFDSGWESDNDLH